MVTLGSREQIRNCEKDTLEDLKTRGYIHSHDCDGDLRKERSQQRDTFLSSLKKAKGSSNGEDLKSLRTKDMHFLQDYP